MLILADILDIIYNSYAMQLVIKFRNQQVSQLSSTAELRTIGYWRSMHVDSHPALIRWDIMPVRATAKQGCLSYRSLTHYTRLCTDKFQEVRVQLDIHPLPQSLHRHGFVSKDCNHDNNRGSLIMGWQWNLYCRTQKPQACSFSLGWGTIGLLCDFPPLWKRTHCVHYASHFCNPPNQCHHSSPQQVTNIHMLQANNGLTSN